MLIFLTRGTKRSDGPSTPSAMFSMLTLPQSLPIRQFLLTNLIRSEEDNTLKFRVPLSVIGGSLDHMADFPFEESDNLHYDGPTLFVRGTKSKYVSDDTVPAIKKFFPNAQIVDVEAGHWLISENPEAFRQGNYSLFSTTFDYFFMLTR